MKLVLQIGIDNRAADAASLLSMVDHALVLVGNAAGRGIVKGSIPLNDGMLTVDFEMAFVAEAPPIQQQAAPKVGPGVDLLEVHTGHLVEYFIDGHKVFVHPNQVADLDAELARPKRPEEYERVPAGGNDEDQTDPDDERPAGAGPESTDH